MSYGINQVFLLGRIGRDVVLQHTAKGSCMTQVSLATTDVWRDKSGIKQERTQWQP